MNREQKLKKEIEDLKLINQKAEEDFNATLNNPKNNVYDTDILEKTFLDIAQRVERKQYTPEFFAYHMNIYWRQIIQHFRNMYDKDIKEAKAQTIKEEIEFLETFKERMIIGKGNKRIDIKERIRYLSRRLKS